MCRAVRILNRVERKGAPHVYLTPFWVFLSKNPITNADLIDARRKSVHYCKVR